MSKKNSAHVYDYIIVGAGLNGLSLAAALSNFTENILLLDGADQVGGLNRKIQFPNATINNGIRFAPATDSSEKAFSFLENILGLKIVGAKSELAPVQYEGGQLRSFLGFGDNPPEFYEQIQYFTSHANFDFKLEPYAWPELLMSKFKGDFHPRSYVTKFLETDGHVTQVMVNGAKTYNGQNFIFCGPIKALNVLLPAETISAKARQKLSKSTYWTALCLDICHRGQVTDSQAMHILNGTTQDEIGPCAGKFLPAVEVDGEQLQTSQWITFVDEVVTEDSETVGHALKKIKRQIKRVYPEALENIKLERIMVSSMIGGNGDFKLNSDQTVGGLKNLWIASGAMNDQVNLVAALRQAELVLSSLGFKIEAQYHDLSCQTDRQLANFNNNPCT